MNNSIRINELKAPRPIKEGSETSVVAMATVNLGKTWVVENCRILRKGEGERFISMPQYKGKDKEGNETWKDIAHPITAEANAQLRESLAANGAEVGEETAVEVVSVRVNALKAPRPLKEGSETSVVAMATVNLGDWVVENCRILRKGEGECFISMPQYKTRDAEGNEVWRDVAHPITAEANAQLKEAVAAACAEAGL